MSETSAPLLPSNGPTKGTDMRAINGLRPGSWQRATGAADGDGPCVGRTARTTNPAVTPG